MRYEISRLQYLLKSIERVLKGTELLNGTEALHKFCQLLSEVKALIPSAMHVIESSSGSVAHEEISKILCSINKLIDFKRQLNLPL